MTNQLEICNVAKETIEVLKYFDSNFVSQISNKFLSYLEELANGSNISVTIDKNKKLKDQKLSSECKDLISIIYYSYIATDKDKEEIVNIWKNNETLYQKMTMEKYNPDDLFKTGEEVKQEYPKLNEEKSLAVTSKEKWYTKIFNKIKSFFK